MPPLDDKQQLSLNTLLYDAVSSSNLERVKLCLSRGAQAAGADMKEYFRRQGQQAVPLAHLAVWYYDGPVLDALAQAGLQVDEKDSDGFTALARAVRSQKLDCVQHFLRLGASPLAETNDGRTVLDIANAAGGCATDMKNKLIDGLLKALPPVDAAFNAAAPAAEAPAAEAAPEAATEESIRVIRPIKLAPRKRDGFRL